MEINENSYTQEAIARLRMGLQYILSLPESSLPQWNLLKYFVASFFATLTNTIPDEISSNFFKHDKDIVTFRNWETERKNSPLKINESKSLDLSESEHVPINQSTTTSELIIYQSATTSDEKNKQLSTTPTLDLKKNRK